MKTHFSQGPTAAKPSAITVRVPAPEQVKWFDGLLAGHHYLGAGRPVGDYLRQVVERDGRPVALLVWGSGLLRAKGSRPVDFLERQPAD